jgi:sugar lactone lactonase YvrE
VAQHELSLTAREMMATIRIMALIQKTAVGAALLGGLLATPSVPMASAAPASTGNSECSSWSVRTLISGQGWLENLAFDGRGSITVSALSQGRLLKLTRSHKLSTLLAPVVAPGGEIRRGHLLYFNTGDTVPIAPTGTVDRLDLRTGRHVTWARGLTMPNGLAVLPDGDVIVTGLATGVTRVPARDPTHPQFNWAAVDGTNGIAVDYSGRWLYVDRTLSSDGEVDRILISHPGRVNVVGRLGAGVQPDDMAIDRQGILYVAGFGTGKIYRLDPRTGSSCVIAGGLTQPTSVRFGGPGWPSGDLFVTDASGHLSELTRARHLPSA